MKTKNKRKSNLSHVKEQIKDINVELKDGVFIYTGPMTVVEFANKIKKPPIGIVKNFFMKGQSINMNATLNEDQIAELCIEFGYDFQHTQTVTASNILEQLKINDEHKDMDVRPPIITIMGHVDHGKTTLIDYIRNSKITNTEFGGITQHTGAYYVTYKKDKKITFLDTPGHEAFTAMRARGAQVTDIVVIVIAADDGVKPQTKEAIDHALAANVPIIVFVNKIDKPNLDLDKVRAQISEAGLTPEEWGGDHILVYGSAKTGKGVDDLLTTILLQSEMLELKSNPNRMPIGTVIESKIEKGRGVVLTIIVEIGTLTTRDFIVAGSEYGRIRTINSTIDNSIITEVKPGMPARITGLSELMPAGSKFIGFHDEKYAKQFANEKKFEDKQKELKLKNTTDQNDANLKIQNIIIKADVSGTAEAIKHTISKIENSDAKVKVIHTSVGETTKADILLATASNAIIYCFNVKNNSNTISMIKEAGITVVNSNVIYNIIEDVQKIIKGLRAPRYREEEIGEAIILKVIYSSKIGNIAGSRMVSGKITANCKVQIYHQNKMVFEGQLDSLKRELNDAKLVDNKKEFGCHIKNFDDIKEGDIIKAFENVLIQDDE